MRTSHDDWALSVVARTRRHQENEASMTHQLTFRQMPHSEAIAAYVDERALKLEHLCSRIIACHVVMAHAGHHHRHGDRYRCSINLAVPGHDIVVSHEPDDDRDLETLEASAGHAFDEAERQLSEWLRRSRTDRHPRVHNPVPHTGPSEDGTDTLVP
jgi:ribosome-associated translation inhibitor RaiA